MTTRRRRSRKPRARVKKGNLFFFILIGLAALIWFNQDLINQKLKEFGIVDRGQTTTANPNGEDANNSNNGQSNKEGVSSQTSSANKETTTDQSNAASKGNTAVNNGQTTDASKKNASGNDKHTTKENDQKVESKALPTGDVSLNTAYDNVVFVGKNDLRLQSKSGDIKQMVPVAKQGYASIKVINKKRGQYALNVSRPGKVDVLVLHKTEGRTDTVAIQQYDGQPLANKAAIEKERKRKERMVIQDNGKYTWGVFPDTLNANQKQKVTVEIAEVDPTTIRVFLNDADGGSKLLKAIDKKGSFEVPATKDKAAKIEIKIEEGKNMLHVGEHLLHFVAPKVDATKKTEAVATKTANASIPTNLIIPNNRGTKDFYAGIDNQIRINVRNKNEQNLKLEASKGKLKKKGPGLYTLNLQKPDSVTLTLKELAAEKDPTIIGQTAMAVLRLPDPQVKINGQFDRGTIALADFKTAKQLIANLPKGLQLPVRFEIVDYTIKHLPADDKPKQITNKGAVFADPAKEMVSKAKAGDLFYFKDIRVRGSDQSVRKLPSLTFEVTE